MAVALKSHPFFGGVTTNNKDLDSLIKLFEEKSRNYRGVDFSSQPTLKKILVVGFDPFGLGANPKQSNPSGCVALALHGKILKDNNQANYALIQSMIVPVRYSDFDSCKSTITGDGDGIIEKYIEDFIVDSAKRVDMILTISQSRVGNFNIDRFATINRGGGEDNLNAKRNKHTPCVKLLKTESAFNWIQTTLPKAMVPEYPVTTTDPDPNPNAQGHWILYAQNYQVVGNSPQDNLFDESTDLERDENIEKNDPLNAPLDVSFLGRNKKQVLNNPLQKGTYIQVGTGSNYLSNELFYRVALIRERWLKTQTTGTEFPTGHFHIAKLQETTSEDFNITKTQKLISTVKDRIKRGVLNLTDLFTNHETDN